MSEFHFEKNSWFEDYSFVKRVEYEGLTQYPENWIKADDRFHYGVKFVSVKGSNEDAFYVVTFGRRWYGKRYVKSWSRVSPELVNTQKNHSVFVYYKDKSFRRIYGTRAEVENYMLNVRNILFPDYQYVASTEEKKIDEQPDTVYTGISG